MIHASAHVQKLRVVQKLSPARRRARAPGGPKGPVPGALAGGLPCVTQKMLQNPGRLWVGGTGAPVPLACDARKRFASDTGSRPDFRTIARQARRADGHPAPHYHLVVARGVAMEVGRGSLPWANAICCPSREAASDAANLHFLPSLFFSSPRCEIRRHAEFVRRNSKRKRRDLAGVPLRQRRRRCRLATAASLLGLRRRA